MKELLFFLLGCFLSLYLQAQSLSTDCNQLRGGDRLMKRMVTACEPGENGVQRVWDFGGLELRDANYELKYVLQGTDTVIGTEHCTMYYYRTSGDSLFCLGYENPTTFIAYQKPELLLVFPVFQGRVVTDYFDGMGNYCERLEVWLRGKSTVTADASGVLILPGGDTLRKVLRTYTHKCIYQGMIPKVAIQDSLQIDTIPFVLDRDSIENLLTKESIRLETETWRWYADGYRYPVFETVKSTVYKFGNAHEHFTASFVYLPEEQYYDLPYDTDNQGRRDLASDERKWEPIDKNDRNERDNAAINYNFRIENDGNIYFNYRLKQSGEVWLILYDLQGQQLTATQHANQTVGDYIEKIPMKSYPKGEYLLRIAVGKEVYGEKFLKP